MPLTRIALLFTVLCFELGCGDHYEGGGRRRELPIAEPTDSELPNIGPSDGASGGVPPTESEPGAAGAAGAAGST